MRFSRVRGLVWKATMHGDDKRIKKPELWWIDEQAAEIVISDHYWNNNYITVKWKDGTETTVPAKAKHHWETPDVEINEEYIPPVRKIKAEQ